MAALLNPDITLIPRSLSPQPSTFCNTDLADNEDNKNRERLSAVRAEETDKASEVVKSLSSSGLQVLIPVFRLLLVHSFGVA